jgi:NADH-quinone oxidoreductase subunit J
MIEMVLFFLLAIVAVASGVGVVAQRSAVRSALFLLVNFCCLAGLYVLLNAQFVAVVQVIIYAGAIVVLFLFVVMLLGMERAEETTDLRRYQWISGILLGALLLAGLVWAVIQTTSVTVSDWVSDGVRAIGQALVTSYVIPFELAAVVLLVAIIGALVLAKRRLEE